MQTSTKTISIVVAVILFCCCALVVIVAACLVVAYRWQDLFPTVIVTATPFGMPPTVGPVEGSSTALPATTVPTDTLAQLEGTGIPAADFDDLACRLQERCNLPTTLTPPSAPRQVGEEQKFWVTNQDTLDSTQVTATLRYTTPHVYFWVQNQLSYDLQDVQVLADAFENKIYSTDRAFFGSEWSPGIDGDVHIYILYASGLGSGVAGLFPWEDEFLPQVEPYSNAHEMFEIDSSQQLDDPYTFGTLAHEFQHMIEWNQHRNQDTWMSEGTADLAAFINGYDTGGFDAMFLSHPDMQLNDWPDDPNNPDADEPNYGASFLFMDYFLNRFGEQATRTLVHETGNGLDGIDQALRDINAVDPQTRQPIHADDLFLDWAVTNYIHRFPNVAARYQYENYPDAPVATTTETISACPLDPADRTVHQYGSDYISITCKGNYTLHFAGAGAVRLLPVDAHSGSYDFWSNLGDSSDMTLTRQFDFSGVKTPIAFSYWTWYDIEEGWDYVYLEASTDGQHWDVLITPSGTDKNPTGSSFGWGYTGSSNGWQQESVDLSRYAGQKVSLRFEYVTDAGVNGDGFLLDDVAIPAIQYTYDFDGGDGGWQAQGFARVENVLPQNYRLALIQYKGAQTTVQDIPVAADGTADVPLTVGQDGVVRDVLVVTGTTRFTRNLADYKISVR